MPSRFGRWLAIGVRAVMAVMALVVAAYVPAGPNSQTVVSMPTRAGGGGTPERYNGLLVTPLPDEKIQVGAITQSSSPPVSFIPLTSPAPSRYSIKNQAAG